ncbi:MAG: glycosyltransferase family 2 protein [Burkholderiales bacterium]|jgi:glycosyltransferase involved in cell wall biosynthesis|nr:glycosyltransferase family 2 protein [Burkholderiales bacterium]
MNGATPKQDSGNPPTLSVVVPMYNETANVLALYDRLRAVLEATGERWELIFVNDGSRDETLAALTALHQRDVHVRVIDLARNFGKEVALSAGLDHASGEAIIPIDADLQDPPELIPELLRCWKDGAEVVNATRRSRDGEGWVKKTTANMFYYVLEKMTRIPIPRNTGDFRLISRPALQVLQRMPERSRFMKGMFAWVGFRQATVLFDRAPRHAGATKWNYWRLWNLALEGITSFSSLPLRVWSYLGLGVATFAFLYMVFLMIRTLIFGIDVPGYASLMVVVLFIGGIQLIGLGVLGEYLARIFEEVKARPLYVVREQLGFSQETVDYVKTLPGR